MTDIKLSDVFDELLSKNFLITVGAVALLLQSFSFCNYSNINYLISLMIGVFVFYNFKLFFHNLVRSVITILILTFVTLQSHLTVLSYLVQFFCFLTTFFYHSSIFKNNLRSVPYLKLFLIGSIWVLLTSFIPLAEKKLFVIDKLDFLFMLERFVFLTAMALLFDVRDIDSDTQKKLKTIPNKLGIFYTKILVVNLLVFWIILSLNVYSGYNKFIVIFTFMVGTIFVLLIDKKWKRTTYNLIFDGLILIHSTLMTITLSELF